MNTSKWLERYDKLNEQQKKAVDTIDGPVLVIAGPGSGKTELLSIRTANILQKTDVLPSNVLLLTFTDSGSFNMRERLISLIGETAYRICIYTFHSFASDLINKYPEYFFHGANFSPAVELDQIHIVENILKTLPRKNILGTYHPELGYVYLRDILSSIRDLKKGNFTPEGFAEKLKQNKIELNDLRNILDPLEDINGKRKYDEVLVPYIQIYNDLKKIAGSNSFARMLYSSLEIAINKASIDEKTKPLTSWRNTYTCKTESGKYILRDNEEQKIDKLESLLAVYTTYQDELYKRGLYDFEDMILLALKTLKENPNLKADLQEKYQYIMIDEFQDTNDSQFGLVIELTKNIFNADRPNILAVGDDDQAIFKFQGAELNNVYSFINIYKDTEIIVLDKNYRSTQDILDFARQVILKAEDRIEVRDKRVVKNLKASHPKYLSEIKKGEIRIEKFDSSILEFQFIAEEIKKLLLNNNQAKEIAVICRKHEQLRQLSEVLNSYKIQHNYSKKDNVLEKPHIKQLITIVKFLFLRQNGEGEDLLPEILSYDFWGLQRIHVWQIAEEVRNKHTSWLETMIKSPDLKLKQIANFLIELQVKSLSTPLEYLLDELIGNTEFLQDSDEHDDNLDPIVSLRREYTSPFKDFYFSKENLQNNKFQYLDFLYSLKTFMNALREFHSSKTLHAKDIFEFVETYTENHLILSTESPLTESINAVQLLTAHAAKGLEFEYVFLLSTDDETWKKANRGNKISFPSNMSLAPEKDNDDDKIRLLYVALTRAKHTLYITHCSNRLEYLAHLESAEVDNTTSIVNKLTPQSIQSLNILPTKKLLDDEQVLLKRILKDYKMPVTHLNNFLNFTKVGPENFIENNLLKFPQAVSPSSAYGTAMHGAIENVYLYHKQTKKFPTIKSVKDNFKTLLEKGRLPKIEFDKYLESGYENLEIYLTSLKKKYILSDTKVELKFRSEDVVVNKCPITGNIDRLEIVSNDEIVVTDLKTGSSYESFEETGLQDYEKTKLHFYKYQLAFYALLVENSRTYHTFKVKIGNLEFLEANQKGQIIVSTLQITNELKERVARLISIICDKIHKLDFPDTSAYPKTYKGILQFEEDLLSGKV